MKNKIKIAINGLEHILSTNPKCFNLYFVDWLVRYFRTMENVDHRLNSYSTKNDIALRGGVSITNSVFIENKFAAWKKNTCCGETRVINIVKCPKCSSIEVLEYTLDDDSVDKNCTRCGNYWKKAGKIDEKDVLIEIYYNN